MKPLKEILKSIAGVLVCLIYLAGIVGFDIHIDHHDGHVFVVSLLQHTDCESIHPDDVCHCCAHHHGDCHEDDEDCENIIEHLDITGAGDHQNIQTAPDNIIVDLGVGVAVNTVKTRVNRIFTKVSDPPREHLSRICVLRV